MLLMVVVMVAALLLRGGGGGPLAAWPHAMAAVPPSPRLGGLVLLPLLLLPS